MSAGSGIPSNEVLPPGWCWASTDDLFTFVTSGSRGWAKYYADEGAMFLRIGNLDHASISLDLGRIQRVDPPTGAETDRTAVRPGDLLISVTADVGMIGLAPDRLGRAHINQHIALSRPTNLILGEYLAWYLASEHGGQSQFKSLQRGATKAGLGLDDIKSINVPVAPSREQHRIVENIESYLTRLDDAVASLERVQRNLKRYRASLLKAAVEGRLVPTEAELARTEGRDYEPASVLLERILKERRNRWIEDAAEKARAKAEEKANKAGKPWTKKDNTKTLEAERAKAAKKYKEPAAPDTRGLPELPEGWCWATVEQLASDSPRSIQSGPFGSNLLHSEFQPAGRLVVGIDNVQDGYFSMGSQNRISEEKFRGLEKYRARPGDVLITVMATIGRCCVMPDDLEPAIITKHVYRVSVERLLVSPRYLHMALWGGPAVRHQMFGSVQGQTRPGLNGTIVKRLSIPVPPRLEQDRIVSEAERLLSIRDEAVAALEVTRERCQRLRQSILKWAFEGKLVDQDPNDEPATVLLERIRAERAAIEATDTKKKGRQRKSK